MSIDTATEAKRFNFSKILILSAWILMLILAIAIIGGNVWAMLHGIQNETLTNWGSIVMGFIFGSFVSVVKDFIAK